MNIESITDELKLEKQSLEAERAAAFKIAPPGEYQAANYQRRESIIIRFQYLLETLIIREDKYSAQHKQLGKLKEQNAELKKDLNREIISNAASPGGEDLNELNRNQARELRSVWAERDEDKKKIDQLEQRISNKNTIILEKENLVDQNEAFFENLKQILERTRPIVRKIYNKDYFGQGG